MCIADKYLNEIDKLTNKLQSDIKKLREKQSEYDKELSSIYHKIETKNFNACEGYYLSKELQIVLQKRRLVKHELEMLFSMHDSLDLNRIINQIPKVQKTLNNRIKYHNNYTKKFDFQFNNIKEEVFH